MILFEVKRPFLQTTFYILEFWMSIFLNEGAGTPTIEIQFGQIRTLLMCLFKTLLSMPMLLRRDEYAPLLGLYIWK